METSLGTPARVPEQEFAGQVAFVTGGAAGIGLAIAETMAERGARVALFDRDAERTPAAAGSKSGGLRGTARA